MKVLKKLKKVPKTVTGVLLIVAGYVAKTKVPPVGDALIYIGGLLMGVGGVHKVQKQLSGRDPFESEKAIASVLKVR